MFGVIVYGLEDSTYTSKTKHVSLAVCISNSEVYRLANTNKMVFEVVESIKIKYVGFISLEVKDTDLQFFHPGKIRGKGGIGKKEAFVG